MNSQFTIPESLFLTERSDGSYCIPPLTMLERAPEQCLDLVSEIPLSNKHFTSDIHLKWFGCPTAAAIIMEPILIEKVHKINQ